MAESGGRVMEGEDYHHAEIAYPVTAEFGGR